jgi:hypothetical protein
MSQCGTFPGAARAMHRGRKILTGDQAGNAGRNLWKGFEDGDEEGAVAGGRVSGTGYTGCRG